MEEKMKQMKQQIRSLGGEPIGVLNEEQMERIIGGMRMEIIQTGNNITWIPPGDPNYLQAEIIDTGNG
jgi:hypothetical protein